MIFLHYQSKELPCFRTLFVVLEALFAELFRCLLFSCLEV
jgi:hypothetical protein